MSREPIAIRFNTPTRTPEPGRGFYQLEEDALYVQIGAAPTHRSFFSYLESPQVRLECDRCGKLCFIEVSVPRRQWQVVEPLLVPNVQESADLRVLDFRRTIPPPRLLTNHHHDSLLVQFSGEPPSVVARIAERVIAGVGANKSLSCVWIEGIIDDLAGQEIAAYRRSLRPQEDKEKRV